MLPVAEDGGEVQGRGQTGQVQALQADALHPGGDPLDDQIALELGYGADNDHDSPAQRAASVELFAKTDALDAQAVEPVEELQSL
jgi:hypothetical protein